MSLQFTERCQSQDVGVSSTPKPDTKPKTPPKTKKVQAQSQLGGKNWDPNKIMPSQVKGD